MRAAIGHVPGKRWHIGSRSEQITGGLRTVGCLVTLVISIFLAPLASDSRQPGEIPQTR
jgi:hypothetical protein